MWRNMLRPYKENGPPQKAGPTQTNEASQAADSERKKRWKRGPVKWTPTSFSPWDWESATWTTRPWVAKSASLRREV